MNVIPDKTEALIYAAFLVALEAEGIRPCKIMSSYNIMFDNYNIRIDHIPTKTTVSHYAETFDLGDPKRMTEKVVNPMVMKMLEALTS